MEDTLTLEWTNLIHTSELTYNKPHKSGVYIWGFTIDNVFIPYYVGIANDIIFRIQEHISFIMTGRYNIFHKDSLASFKNYKVNKDENKNEGMIYKSTFPKDYKSFLKCRKELQPHLDFMVDTFTFSFALVNSETVSGQDLKEIEKICIEQIGMLNLANTRGGYSNKFSLTHTGNETVTNFMKGKSI